MFAFLFHGQRIVVEDLEAELTVAKDRLLDLIGRGADERTMERQERRVRKLTDLVERPSLHGNRT